MAKPTTFHLTIDSIEEFVLFCAAIRGETVDQLFLEKLTTQLTESSQKLADAEAADHLTRTPSSVQQEIPMSSPILDALAAAVSKATTVESSAVALISGMAARIQAAVDAAIAGGATAEELAPVQAEADALSASADSLAAAVTANTPPPPAAARRG